MRHRRRAAPVLPVVAACAATLIPSAPASAVTIGANLSRQANAPNSCQYFPSTDFQGFRQYFGPYPVDSCSYIGTGDITGREVAGAPAPGVITRVRVKAGPVVGPVRASIVEAIANPEFACCFGISQSQVFTPRPNSITSINVRLPMRNDTNSDANVQTVDYLALSVVGTDYPVPAFDGGFPGDVTRSSALGFGPMILPGQTRTDGGGATDYVPLINAEFSPICGAAGASSAGARLATADGVQLQLPTAKRAGGGGCAPRAKVGGVARVRGGKAVIPLACNSAFGCRGILLLQGPSGAGAGASAVTTYASKRFNLRPGARGKVKAPLNAAGRALLRGRSRARVVAKLRFKGAGTPKTMRRRLTLRG